MMIKKILFSVSFSASLFILAACAGTQNDVPASFSGMDADAAPMLERIIDFNSKAVNTYDMGFTVESITNKQTYKMNGSAQFDGSLKKLYFAFTDFVFKSPLCHVFGNEGEVVLYFPSEKKLFRHNAKTMTFRDYGNINLSYQFIYPLITGRIPLIDGYKVKNAIVDGKASYLILESGRYYQTVSFTEDIPDRLKITDKTDGSETEFYFGNWKQYGEARLFRKLSIVSAASNMRVNVIVNSARVNIPVKVKGINDITIPSDVTSINRK